MGDAYIGIPKAVRIGCYPFRIEVGEIEDHETAGTFGHMNPISQKIRLRPGMSAQKLANTFIHEVLHGIYWFMSAGHFRFRMQRQYNRAILLRKSMSLRAQTVFARSGKTTRMPLFGGLAF